MTPLRVLLAEESEDDALLIVRELQRGGFEPSWGRVDMAPGLTAALARQEWDLITCDWMLPRLRALLALTIIQKHGFDGPIIIVSSQVGEEVAVRAMKAGAHDYISKHDLARLVPAVERELRAADERRERRRAEDEAQARQTELAHVLRVATLREMAGELTHEINQPLAAIVNFANGLAVRLQDGLATREVIRDVAEGIAAEALRAAAVIQRVRDLVRKGGRTKQPRDLNDLVREATHLIAPEARRHTIPVRLALGSGLPSVNIDRVQVEQVVLNLLRNGIEAIAGDVKGGNELLVETRVGGSKTIEVRIRDTGVGLPDGAESRIFEAFFTTKKDGLGMGLSISRSIIEAHGGRLWVVPNVSRGATFGFTLPCSDGETTDA